MNIDIQEVSSTVRSVAGMTAEQQQAFLDKVLAAIKDHEAHAKRTEAERRITGGVAAEQDHEA